MLRLCQGWLFLIFNMELAMAKQTHISEFKGSFNFLGIAPHVQYSPY
jgi:hypothetical protein